ncbi:MAG: type II secretion system protein [Verrucomicrobiota bacterium]
MNTIQLPQASHARRRGLTLIELVVVLAILVALVGLVVSLFPGLVARASRSTTASSIQDVARAVQINYTTTLGYGSGFDSLLNSGGASVYSGLTTLSSNQIARITLSANDAAALIAAGVTNLVHMTQVTGSNPDATFNVSVSNTPFSVAPSVAIAVLDATQTSLIQSLRGSYIPRGSAIYPIFGINKSSNLVGPQGVMQDAPVRAGSTAIENPAVSYQRYGLVFLLEDAVSGTARSARFLGAVAFTAGGIQTAEGNLQGYYTN